MIDKSLTLHDKENIIRYLVRCYRRSRQRQKIDVYPTVQETRSVYECDQLTVNLFESALEAIPDSLREIIVREFLDENTEGWYYNYYSKSTFYRLRQKAISEFLDCLNV